MRFVPVVVAYLLAVVAAVTAVELAGELEPWAAGALATTVGTVIVYAFSFFSGNSSFYDPYWSVAPPALVAGWMALAPDGDPTRAWLALAVMSLWGARLTWNWARGWTGLEHEDWRYLDFKRRTGRWWWVVSFVAIHFFPTVQTFLGTLPLAWAVASPAPLGPVEIVGAALVAAGTLLEGVADDQLRAFRLAQAERRDPEAVLDTGLWAYSRHPNYLGELTVWLGAAVFGIGAGAPAWSAVGFVAIAAMFAGYSIPAMDKRSLARRPAYARVLREVPALIPIPGRRAGAQR